MYIFFPLLIPSFPSTLIFVHFFFCKDKTSPTHINSKSQAGVIAGGVIGGLAGVSFLIM